MKKSWSLILFTILINTVTAQIPNPGFENWTSMGSYENPDSWGVMNNTTASTGVFTAIKGTPGNPGSSYLKLISLQAGSSIVNGVAVSGKLDSTTMEPISGFPFNQRPQSFTGKWQHMIFGTRQGSVSAVLTRWDQSNGLREVVATAVRPLSGMAMSWADFSIDFTYQGGEYPDTCIIVLKASGNSPASNDYLWVDDLAFSGVVAGTDESNREFNVTTFPNPANSVLAVSYPETMSNGNKMIITDMNGRVIFKKPLTGHSMTIPVSGFAEGIYIYKIVNLYNVRLSEGKITVRH